MERGTKTSVWGECQLQEKDREMSLPSPWEWGQQSVASCQLLIGLSWDLSWWLLWWLGQKYKGLIFMPTGDKGPAIFPQKGHCRMAIRTREHPDIPVYHSCPSSSPPSCFPNLPFTHLDPLEPELDGVWVVGKWREHDMKVGYTA